MPPKTSRDFQKAAAQRLIAAKTLQSERLTLDAQYIGGYTIECSLKALILEFTPPADMAGKLLKITTGSRMHRYDVLFGELRNLNPTLVIPIFISKRMWRFDWAPDLRYETGRRDVGETTAFLTTAEAIYDWVEGQIA